MIWKLRISLAFQTECSCGWTSNKRMMERDAVREWSDHNREKHNG